MDNEQTGFPISGLHPDWVGMTTGLSSASRLTELYELTIKHPMKCAGRGSIRMRLKFIAYSPIVIVLLLSEKTALLTFNSPLIVRLVAADTA